MAAAAMIAMMVQATSPAFATNSAGPSPDAAQAYRPADAAAPGQIAGTVTGFRVCDASQGPVNRAPILLTSSTGFTQTLETESGGKYSVWLDPADSPVTLTVSQTGFISQTMSGIAVTSGVTTTQNFSLHADAPCLSPLPGALSALVRPGFTADKTLQLGNTGAHALSWSLAEKPQTAQPAVAGLDLIHDGGFEAGSANPFWEEQSLQFETPLCDADDCGGNRAHSGTWWAWFGGTEELGRAVLEQAAITQTVRIPSGPAQLSFYVWLQHTTGSATDTLKLLADGHTLWSTDGSATDYTGGYTQVTVNLAAYADGQLHAITFASQTNDQGEGTSFMVDDVALNAQPAACSGDIPWLSVSPVSGTIPAASTGPVTVHFDPTGLAAGSTYTGTLCLTSDDAANPFLEAPVSLTAGYTAMLPLLRRGP